MTLPRAERALRRGDAAIVFHLAMDRERFLPASPRLVRAPHRPEGGRQLFRRVALAPAIAHVAEDREPALEARDDLVEPPFGQSEEAHLRQRDALPAAIAHLAHHGDARLVVGPRRRAVAFPRADVAELREGQPLEPPVAHLAVDRQAALGQRARLRHASPLHGELRQVGRRHPLSEAVAGLGLDLERLPVELLGFRDAAELGRDRGEVRKRVAERAPRSELLVEQDGLAVELLRLQDPPAVLVHDAEPVEADARAGQVSDRTGERERLLVAGLRGVALARHEEHAPAERRASADPARRRHGLQREVGREEALGLRERVLAQRALRGVVIAVHRLGVPPRPLEVVAESREVVRPAISRPGLDRARDGVVERDLACRGHARVRHLADLVVRDADGSRPVLDDARGRELPEQIARVGGRKRERRRRIDEPRLHLAAEHAQEIEHRTGPRGEPLDAPQDQVAQRPRHLELAPRERPIAPEAEAAVAVAGEPAFRHRGAKVFRHEERVPFRLGGDAIHEVLRRRRDREHVRHHLAHGRDVEPLERVAPDARARAQPGDVAGGLLGAIGGDHEEPRQRHRREGPEEPERELVGPLEIVEDQHERPIHREPEEDRGEGMVETEPRRLGAERRQRRCVEAWEPREARLVGDERRPGDSQEPPREGTAEVLASIGDRLERLPERAELPHARGPRIGGESGALAAQHVDAAPPRIGRKLRQDAGLPRPALPGDQNDAASTGWSPRPATEPGDHGGERVVDALAPGEVRAVEVGTGARRTAPLVRARAELGKRRGHVLGESDAVARLRRGAA
ncbi:MAG: hypothetical protein U0166_21390 [Acidobacteriota bacterium]